MNKLFLTLAALLLTNVAFASEASVSGSSHLKLDDSVRAARKEIEKIDKQIANLNKEIAQEQSLAATYKALPNNGSPNTLRSAQIEALATANLLERDQLMKQRAELEEVLTQ